VSALFGQTFRCSSRRAGPRYFSVTATQPQASQATSRSAAFTARRVRAASPAGQSCSSNSRRAHRSEGRSHRRPQTPHDATPGLSSAASASSRRFALPQATRPTLPTGKRSADSRRHVHPPHASGLRADRLIAAQAPPTGARSTVQPTTKRQSIETSAKKWRHRSAIRSTNTVRVYAPPAAIQITKRPAPGRRCRSCAPR
jgi:hypothetical protein